MKRKKKDKNRFPENPEDIVFLLYNS